MYNNFLSILSRKKNKKDQDSDADSFMSVFEDPANSSGLKELVPGRDPVAVDIVAVHGLNGHREQTWTHESTGKMWLRDFLPERVPCARILSFGYNGYTCGRFARSTLSLHDHGVTLAQDLQRYRDNSHTENRPIIFVAHDVGGLVVKHTLLYCDSAKPGFREAFSSIKTSTHGVMFFGTPHTGNKSDDLSHFVTRITHTFTLTNDKITRHLDSDSEHLFDLNQSYLSICDDFKSYCFFAAYASDIRGAPEKVVPRESAILIQKNTVNVALDKDHANLVKYDVENESSYTKVVDYIAALVKELIPLQPGGQESGFQHPRSIFDMPYPRNLNFTGRTKELKELSLSIQAPKTGHPRMAVLHGMPGVGKTEIALEYVWQNFHSYKAILWINASSETTIVADFVSKTQELIYYLDSNQQLIQGYSSGAAYLGLHDSIIKGHSSRGYNSGELVRAMLHWLASQDENSWLLVFDKWDGSESTKIRPYFPKSIKGAIIVTTRATQTQNLGSKIEVDVMEKKEAIQLLKKVLDMETELGELHLIVDKLGYLPLAIEQASAYTNAQRITINEYLSRYERSFCSIMDEIEDKPTTYENTLFATWKGVYEEILRKNEQAVKLLLLLGFLSNEISSNIILHGKALHEQEFDRQLRVLLSYSLIKKITRKDQKTIIYVHPITQKWIQCFLSKKERIIYIEQVCRLLAKTIQEMKQQSDDKLRLFAVEFLPDLKACYEHLQNNDPRLEHISEITWKALYEMALAFLHLKCYTCMCTILEPLHIIQMKAIEERRIEKIDLIRTKAALAICYDKLDRHAEAEALHQEASQKTEALFGNKHPLTLKTKGNLANWYSMQQKHAEAKEIYKEILQIQQQESETAAGVIVVTKGNLANCYNELKEYIESERLYEQVLTDQRKYLPSDDPDIIRTKANLASCFLRQKKYYASVQMYNEVLLSQKRTFGPSSEEVKQTEHRIMKLNKRHRKELQPMRLGSRD